MKKRVVIIDDHTSVREMLALLLSRDGTYEVVGQAESGRAALALCRKTRPDIVILDLVLPEINGSEVLRHLRGNTPSPRVLIYSGTSNRTLVLEALRCQPHGFVEKGDSFTTLRQALDAVSAGCTYFSAFATGMLRSLPGPAEREKTALSSREREVLQMIAEGLSSKEISSRLSVAVRTVENHRANLMQKLHLHSIAGLTRHAVREGMVEIE